MLIDEIRKTVSDGFTKDNKRLYLELHLQAFQFTEVTDLDCDVCIVKLFTDLQKFIYMAKEKKEPTGKMKLKDHLRNSDIFVKGHGLINGKDFTQALIKFAISIGLKELFEEE